MPIFFQHKISDHTRLGIWKIEETEEFFNANVPQHRDVTHPHKRLQHLAGRFLLQFLFPDFPFELIRIADTHKPFLPEEQYHFSISHCGDFAAAIVSKDSRVGIDIEIPVEKIGRIKDKFLGPAELEFFFKRNAEFLISNPSDSNHPSGNNPHPNSLLTLLWSAKESVFKWYGEGSVDFRKDILLKQMANNGILECFFMKTNEQLNIHFKQFDQICLAWIEK